MALVPAIVVEGSLEERIPGALRFSVHHQGEGGKRIQASVGPVHYEEYDPSPRQGTETGVMSVSFPLDLRPGVFSVVAPYAWSPVHALEDVSVFISGVGEDAGVVVEDTWASNSTDAVYVPHHAFNATLHVADGSSRPSSNLMVNGQASYEAETSMLAMVWSDGLAGVWGPRSCLAAPGTAVLWGGPPGVYDFLVHGHASTSEHAKAFTTPSAMAVDLPVEPRRLNPLFDKGCYERG